MRVSVQFFDVVVIAWSRPTREHPITIKPEDRQRSKDDPIEEDSSRPQRASQSETNRHSEGPADPRDNENDDSGEGR